MERNQDYAKAESYFNKAVHWGHVEAEYALGNLHSRLENFEMAYKHYECAAEKGYVLALCKLGNLYVRDHYYDKAVKCYEEAREQFFKNKALSTSSKGLELERKGILSGLVGAMLIMKHNFPEVISFCKIAIKLGDLSVLTTVKNCCLPLIKEKSAEASYQLAECYRLAKIIANQRIIKGQSVPKQIAEDLKKMLHYYKEAATLGHANAQYYLAQCYFRGGRVRPDIKMAIEYYKKAADLGHVEAQYDLARTYIEVNPPKDAIKFFKTAADQGHPGACFHLGLLYRGNILSKDLKESVKYLLRAGEKSNESKALLERDYKMCLL